MKVPKDCPLKLEGNVNQPVSCPCYNKQDCDVVSKKEASQKMCQDCSDAKFHDTGSLIWISCRHVKGWRTINYKCVLKNFPR